MCREHRGLIGFASVFGLLQSMLWIAITAAIILIYYCVIGVEPYETRDDFFRVTLIKLYFEGPKCIPDGSYLGKFNEDYRTSVTLIGRELFMFVLIAYAILSVIYFILSILLYLKRQRPKKRFFTIGWSVITLIFCALDLLITYALLVDSFTLMDYFSETSEHHDVLLGTVPYIPLLLSFFSSRLIIVWVWNFFIGIYVLFVGLCGSTAPRPIVQEISSKVENKMPDKAVGKVAEKEEERPKVVQSVPQRRREDRDDSLSVISENFRNGYPSDMIRGCVTYGTRGRSMESVTKFSGEDRMSREYNPHNWCYEPASEMPAYMRPHTQTLRLYGERTNKGYVDDEEVKETFDRSVDFQHNLRNFESGQKQIKVTRPQPGKPVGIPVPPPLPNIGSCNC